MASNEGKDGSGKEVEPKETEFEFCTEGHCCQERLEQPEIPSANTCLPEERLEAVEEDIERANKLLLDLGLENPERNRVIKEAFLGIEGLNVKVELEAGDQTENGEAPEISGKVFLAGNDFVALLKDEKEILIPNEKVSIIKAEGRYAEPVSEPLLSDINPCFRRELTFHFGRTVSASPELIHIFFGMKLAIYLLLLQDKEISVHLEGETLQGILWKASEDSITLRNKDNEQEVNLAHVLYIKYDRKEDKEK
jgi:hypothetical protein